jgi:hypothetical protein
MNLNKVEKVCITNCCPEKQLIQCGNLIVALWLKLCGQTFDTRGANSFLLPNGGQGVH